ncbi:hypothetical protein L841_1629 [Mycobacterium sp. MAC_080597_8934]|nr:hypothetical protein L841_1629 [Mycobacterium sp. MAC_080597_8934]
MRPAQRGGRSRPIKPRRTTMRPAQRGGTLLVDGTDTSD